MIFLDTNVLVASAQAFHQRHAPSLDLLTSLDRSTGVTSAHVLAEVYSITSGLPRPLRLTPRGAERLIESFRQRLTVISLDADETINEILMSSARGVSGAAIYDALIIASARKAGAEMIYTLNLGDFRRIAPDLYGIIREP